MHECDHICKGIITYTMVNDLGEDKRTISIRCERIALPNTNYCDYCTMERLKDYSSSSDFSDFSRSTSLFEGEFPPTITPPNRPRCFL